MNISELEDNLKSRAELFDDLRDKMKTEIHAEFRFELESMKDVNSQLLTENENFKRSLESLKTELQGGYIK